MKKWTQRPRPWTSACPAASCSPSSSSTDDGDGGEASGDSGDGASDDDGPVYEPPAETRPDAYATFLGSEAYAPGAEALLRSLAKRTKNPRGGSSGRHTSEHGFLEH